MKNKVTRWIVDILIAIVAGLIIGSTYYMFQNSNGFAPGGVSGLATITYYLCGYRVSWAILVLAFSVPIFLLVTFLVDKRLGIILIIYMVSQSLIAELLKVLNVPTYSAPTYKEDYQPLIASIITGVLSGVAFSIMLKHFGVCEGTYAIATIIKKKKPEANIAYLSFILDSCVVGIAFFVYGMKFTPVICTLLNLFIANVVVDKVLVGVKDGYRFEIVTDHPEELSQELMEKINHGITQIQGIGMYRHSEKHILVCIVRKKKVGEMMKVIKSHDDTFASVSKVSEVFGFFKSW